MTTVVTGASGHLGSNLVRILLQRGESVRALIHRDFRSLGGLPIERVAGDVLDLDSLLAAFKGAKVVYHLACVISMDTDQDGMVRRVNIEGTRNVVEACLRAGVERLVHFSSIQALDWKPVDEMCDETRPLLTNQKASIYDLSKARGELEIARGIEAGLDAVTVVPTGVVGPFDFRPSLMGTFLIDLYNGSIPMLVGGGYNWVDARDVSLGAIAAAQRGKKGYRYILPGNWYSMEDFAALVKEATGRKVPLLSCPNWLAQLAAAPNMLYCRLFGLRPRFTKESLESLNRFRQISTEKAKRELGYKTRSIQKTIDDTYRWFHNANILRESR